MPRKTSTFTVPGHITDRATGNRDAAKSFLLTEMPADKAERWAVRAIQGLSRAGVELGALGENPSMAHVAALGMQALGGMDQATLEPLMAEMFTCVQYVPDMPGIPTQAILAGENSQIDEVSTRVALRMAVFRLHTGFSLAG